MKLQRLSREDNSRMFKIRHARIVYLETVDAILAITYRINPAKAVQAKMDDFGGDILSGQSLVGLIKTEPTKLEIYTESPSGAKFSVVLGRTQLVRIGNATDLTLRGAAEDVQDLLRTASIRPLEQLPFHTLLLFGFLALLLTFQRIIDQANSGLDGGELLWITAAYAGAMSVVAREYWRRARTKIILAYRSDSPTFWERHGTSVLIGLVTNVLVSAIFFLIGRATA